MTAAHAKGAALGLTFIASMTMAATAYASDQEDFETCKAAIEAQVGEASIRLRGMKGASTRKLSFTVKTGEGTKTATCHIRRGELKDLVWK